ncbi:hypothetical protein [Pseudonocardia sp. ICBG1293]|uniref:hypothetical protein n=1 Tax=Pseudonocardia sp. ICBG1293 TaxID=2844382 RepID=UPI001CCF250C|nr:hypothetical protein [Pseudonocardia sp. ICBG1293]
MRHTVHYVISGSVAERATSPLGPDDYIAVGLQILDEDGSNRALSVRRVCVELGSTTGSFSHHFATWSVYLRTLLTRWAETHQNAMHQLVGTDPPGLAEAIRALLARPPALERAVRCWPGEIAVGAVASVDLMWQDLIVRAAHGDDDTPATVDAVRAATAVRAVTVGLASTETLPDDRTDLPVRHVEIVAGRDRRRLP